jgi:hypothetical protein
MSGVGLHHLPLLAIWQVIIVTGWRPLPCTLQKQFIMAQTPLYLSYLFGAVTILSLWLLYKAGNDNKRILTIALLWLLLQGIMGITGWYARTDALPPRFLLAVLPPLVFIAMLFLTRQGRRFLDSLDSKTLTLLHTVRIAVELILLGLYVDKGIPREMTFEGRNFDILAGATAPFIWYFGFVRRSIGLRWLLLWNIAGIVLLTNIVTIALLSAPTPFQQMAFDQPNVAVFRFPFVWLPCFVVPVVFLSHLAVVRQISRSMRSVAGISLP